MSLHPILAVIPARGGSKGVPGKNIRPLAGVPLLAHAIRFAKLCPQIDHCVVSTDSEEIAAIAKAHGGEVPFLRPTSLAQDDTPMWPVMQHALREMERRIGVEFGSLLLLDPTSPGRLPADVSKALALLDLDPAAVGVIAVSEPKFNPRWVCVQEVGGYMQPLVPDTANRTRRQEVPPVYRINAVLYLWRRAHVLEHDSSQLYSTPHRMLIVPEERALHIDDDSDWRLAELLIRASIVKLAGLNPAEAVP